MPEFFHAPCPVQGQPDKPSVFLATPAIDIRPNHFAAVVKALPMLMANGISIEHFLLADCCHVDDSRNMCVAMFLARSSAEYLLFVDADVGFPPETLYRLIMDDPELDILAGVYPHKSEPKTYPWRLSEDAVKTDADGLIRHGVIGVPTGFLRIRRRVLERMAEMRLTRTFKPFGEAYPPVPIIFERDYVNGERLSGDYAFCRWARELGYEIAVDPMLAFTHQGSVSFRGMLAADLGASAEEPVQ